MRDFPGAYGEGLMAALVEDFTREGIFEAIRARRTYALTGDRIEVDFCVDGAPMGSTIDAGTQVEVSFAVCGRDEIDVVEVIQDGRVVHRAFAAEQVARADAFAAPVQLRLEWGWGPWGALALDRICDWAMQIGVQQGRLLRFFPCLQSMPFDERRRHRFDRDRRRRLAIRSYTARQSLPREPEPERGPRDRGRRRDAVDARPLTEPVVQSRTSLGDLASRLGATCSRALSPRKATSGTAWCRWRLVTARAVHARVPPGRSHVYLRARQKNGHIAWASPVFLNHR